MLALLSVSISFSVGNILGKGYFSVVLKQKLLILFIFSPIFFLIDGYNMGFYLVRAQDLPADEDPFIEHVKEIMPEYINFHFVDNWSVYHMSLGEVHCGSNATRTPEANWWEVAGHLLEEQP